MIQQLPLFPLGMVLFPGTTLNLHIFEDRYRAMIGKCIEENSPFGVVYLRSNDDLSEGQPITRPTETANVGTIAQISANVRLEDGRYLLNALGVQRFRIEYITQRLPYLIAAVAPLPEESGPQVEAAASELRAAYGRYWQAVAIASGSPMEIDDLPEQPEAMAYQLADRFHISYDQKQHWLEAELSDRLRGLTAELLGELAILPPSVGLGNLN